MASDALPVQQPQGPTVGAAGEGPGGEVLGEGCGQGSPHVPSRLAEIQSWGLGPRATASAWLPGRLTRSGCSHSPLFLRRTGLGG